MYGRLKNTGIAAIVIVMVHDASCMQCSPAGPGTKTAAVLQHVCCTNSPVCLKALKAHARAADTHVSAPLLRVLISQQP